ncbi:GDP dissociation inhibitor [Kipferlia bialata]|uniref:GDP dissociation inhibitor n=1 Tax=Kipferlia bialata TaxID=797122 RepID=A0A9K3GFB0_9EUKA|nr:GDP dissociation inhibitor [Kipferlia bialata]|eukprot:g1626.t1
MSIEGVQDVVVLGTGPVEAQIAAALSAAGLQVTVLDDNTFYGGYASSFYLSEILSVVSGWGKEDSNDASVLPPGVTLTDIKAACLQTPETAGEEGETISPVFPPSLSRLEWCVLPGIVYASSPTISSVVAAKVAKYTSFHPVYPPMFLTESQTEGEAATLLTLPTDPRSLFANKTLFQSATEKRYVHKLLKALTEWVKSHAPYALKAAPREGTVAAQAGLGDTQASRADSPSGLVEESLIAEDTFLGLVSRVLKREGEAVVRAGHLLCVGCMLEGRDPAAMSAREGVQQFSRFLAGYGLFRSPHCLLSLPYGMADIPQAFSRLAAVHSCNYVLGAGLSSVELSMAPSPSTEGERQEEAEAEEKAQGEGACTEGADEAENAHPTLPPYVDPTPLVQCQTSQGVVRTRLLVAPPSTPSQSIAPVHMTWVAVSLPPQPVTYPHPLPALVRSDTHSLWVYVTKPTRRSAQAVLYVWGDSGAEAPDRWEECIDSLLRGGLLGAEVPLAEVLLLSLSYTVCPGVSGVSGVEADIDRVAREDGSRVVYTPSMAPLCEAPSPLSPLSPLNLLDACCATARKACEGIASHISSHSLSLLPDPSTPYVDRRRQGVATWVGRQTEVVEGQEGSVPGALDCPSLPLNLPLLSKTGVEDEFRHMYHTVDYSDQWSAGSGSDQPLVSHAQEMDKALMELDAL